jgi:GntR family transcriptional regulator
MTNAAVQPLRANRLPLSAQTQDYLLDLIEDGAYHPGEQLPSEKELAAQLGISRATLREALLNLEQEGVVVRKHGVGTFVARGYEHRLESGLERLESILELAARQQMQVSVGNLDVQETRAGTELAEKLQVPRGTPLTCVCRVIEVDRRPVAYMADYVVSALLSPADVDGTFDGSVLDLLRKKRELRVAQAVANIVAVNAEPALTQKLKVRPDQALLLLEEILFDDEGVAVEFSRNYFIPDRFRFHVVRR